MQLQAARGVPVHTQQQSKRQLVQIQQWTLRSKGSLKDWKTSLAPSQRHLSPWLCWQNVQTNRFYEKQNLIPTKKKCVAQSIPTPFGEIVHVQVLHEETAHWNLRQVLSQTRPYLSKGRNCNTICRSHCVMYVPSWTPALDSLEGFLYTGWSKLGPSYYPPQQRTSHNTSQVQSHHFPAKLPCLAGSFQNPWKLIVKPHSFKTQMTGRIRFWYREPKSMTFEADGSHLSLCNWDYWRRFRWNCGVRRRDTFSNWVWGRWLHHYVWAEIFLVLDLEVFGQNCLQIIPLHVRMYVDIL